MGEMAFDSFEKRILLKGRVQLLSGLHIGAGRETGFAGSDLPVVKDFRGMPFIPGSSFKGVLRSGVEAFLRAFDEQNKQGVKLACDVINDDLRCIGSDQKKKIIEQRDEFSKRDPDSTIWHESCWVCRLFGSPWLASRVQVLDISVDTSSFLPEWMMIRDGVVIDRETETAASRKKFDFEVVPAQTCFHLEIMVDNPADYQMGLLVLGLDFYDRGLSLLGGITSRGLGRIRILIEEIEEETAESIFQKLIPPVIVENDAPAAEGNQLDSDDNLPSKNEDDPLVVVRRLLADGKEKTAEELIENMQQQGWTKERLRGLSYKNWKVMFEKVAGDGHIEKVNENRYQSLEAAARTDKELAVAGQEAHETEEKREIIEKKMQEWRQALWIKLNELKDQEKEGG